MGQRPQRYTTLDCEETTLRLALCDYHISPPAVLSEEVRQRHVQESTSHMTNKYIERFFLEERFCEFVCYLFERLSNYWVLKISKQYFLPSFKASSYRTSDKWQKKNDWVCGILGL